MLTCSHAEHDPLVNQEQSRLAYLDVADVNEYTDYIIYSLCFYLPGAYPLSAGMNQTEQLR